MVGEGRVHAPDRWSPSVHTVHAAQSLGSLWQLLPPQTCADADLLPELAAAKAEGLPLTVETCPHYLNFAAEEVPAGDTRRAGRGGGDWLAALWVAASHAAGGCLVMQSRLLPLPCRFKCAPPLREGENRQRLLQGLAGGIIDSVGTDHSPSGECLVWVMFGALMCRLGWRVRAGCMPAPACSLSTITVRDPMLDPWLQCTAQLHCRPCRANLPPWLCLHPAEPSLKLPSEGDFMRAWGGIAGLQYALPATWQPWQDAGLNLTRFVQASGMLMIMCDRCGSGSMLCAVGFSCRTAAGKLARAPRSDA